MVLGVDYVGVKKAFFKEALSGRCFRKMAGKPKAIIFQSCRGGNLFVFA